MYTYVYVCIRMYTYVCMNIYIHMYHLLEAIEFIELSVDRHVGCEVIHVVFLAGFALRDARSDAAYTRAC